ncbi:hypothetical protein [Paenibacillus sp. 1781tsa1]|uniref:hypothetical protein n=1 Tax=Paenibacillus sp. 1781tsa1 TaxID=2953810 RepID=UPI0020A0EACF|nr:hypothetical protein [Paenibacillus sp. 1781tsa1]MCP1184999.1 hypothetical protein [Paenibacillus sp. 1781tsa1]
MQNVFNHLSQQGRNIIKHGRLDYKMLLELKMMTTFYEYIEINTTYHDNKNDENFISWMDIEGMGYGWRWARYEEEDWYKMMLRLVCDECRFLTKEMKYTYYFVYEYQNILFYHFVVKDKYDRRDRIIQLSNEELWG